MKAKGTIRTRIEKDGTSDILFAPHPDSIVNSCGQKYAVFVSPDNDSPAVNSLAVKFPEQDKGTKDCIKVGFDIADLVFLSNAIVEAAAGQTMVEVEVKESDKDSKKLSLAAITIPASCSRS